jgi:hypothetical protein
MNKVWDTWRDNTHLLLLLAALVVGDEKGVNFMLEGGRLKEVFDWTIIALEDVEKHNPMLSDVLLFFNAISNNELIRNLICEQHYHLEIFSKIKTTDNPKAYLKPLDSSLLPQIVSFVGKICSSDKKEVA